MIKKVFRIDKSKLDKLMKTSQGFLQAPAFVTRTGIFEYVKADGSSLKEYRPESEVFNPISIASLRAAPVTDDHPQELVTADNMKRLAVGYLGDTISQENEFVKVETLTVFDPNVISKVESGLLELSCGYEAELDFTPGEINGEKYDCIQKNIIYNHVALVREGRAGPEVRLRLDSNSAVLKEIADEIINKGVPIMEKITIGGKEYECSPELKAAFEGMAAESKAELDKKDKEMQDAEAAKGSAEEKAKEESDKKDEAEAKLDTALEENKALKTKLDSTDNSKLHKLACERMTLVKIANHVLPKETKIDSMTNSEMKKEIVKAKGVDVSTKSDAYIEARFDSISESVEAEVIAFQSIGVQMLAERKDSKSPDEARKAASEKSKNAWKADAK